MRTRKLVAAAALGLLVALALPGAAHAQDPGTKAGEHLVECVEDALSENAAEIRDEDYNGFENALEDCKKAPSLITPAVPEMVWGGLAFLIVFILLVKFAFPALKKGVKAREEKIRSDLEAAEKARLEAEEERARYQTSLADSRGEANRLVEEAREAAERVRQETIARAEADAAEIRTRASEDIGLARDRAMADLRTQVADISIELAEKIVERNIDRSTQEQLIESYISSVGNR
jgi:F-type H+-transporting ATPase subunit b